MLLQNSLQLDLDWSAVKPPLNQSKRIICGWKSFRQKLLGRFPLGEMYVRKFQAKLFVSTVQTNTTDDFLDLLGGEIYISLPTYCAYYQPTDLQDGEYFLIFVALASNDNSVQFHHAVTQIKLALGAEKKPRRLLLMCDVIPLLLLLLLLLCCCHRALAAASAVRRRVSSVNS